ncbi:PDR/VanB family oxidoreductase [Goodfellowiella coeruleoviolacea]|uniref:Ferredoxin-NADP reductase n=1 Tax=Goodfellowiella coeruleoviolacea TaxID=334858 RepID=A0AAE3KHY2_9PSEU|nr:PDR/VanB family oxidoreductase [Goodfellowiella coeruleoviolacea]MCP2167377.1 Ferredoxin-NADP reductase [Goodfellowiella coeruleoviolacea]
MTTASHTEPELDLVVARKEVVAEGVVRLTLRHPDGRPLPAWQPGAHLDLVLPNGLVRQYSLCGDPHDLSALRVAVLREAAGRGGSRYVHDTLTEGHQVRIRGPRNHFPLVRAERYLFLAGGVGITPILPMVRSVAASGREWHLAYGGRTRTSMAFREELLASYPERVSIHPQDEHGPLDLSSLLAHPGRDATDTAVYCCGPESLLLAVERHCAAWPAGALHVERFSPRATAAEGPRESFEVELARAGRVLTVPAEHSILAVVEQAGVPVLSSCREGTCGTCETTVLSGRPDHRDSVLTDEEKATADVMMICVSRSCSPRLVLDL